MAVAKVFRNGNSQAVRLPREFRFPAGVSELSVRREGCAVILEPRPDAVWPESFWRAFGVLDESFQRAPGQGQLRADLDS
ncbi:MAG TPA: AbrB/MazE/SpoVT family DNA-binding domain-containing protein [Acidimicrobiia bacterium]|nr:AbrB/MazE/SpoVT family DNA-binding domain-containing protein [Acidimicrobiia bacterium]